MAAISREELIRLARAGAIARVNELRAELESIYGTFPDLRTGATRGRAPKAATAAPAVRKSSAKANRAWSAAARKAVSERMKKYWATRRAKTTKAAK